jgi:hypothetical protein
MQDDCFVLAMCYYSGIFVCLGLGNDPALPMLTTTTIQLPTVCVTLQFHMWLLTNQSNIFCSFGDVE